MAVGPILFGYCLDIFLFGVLTVQTYLYYLAFPNDRRVTKALVYFVYIVGTLQTAFALHDFYTLFCTPEGKKHLDGPSSSGLQKFGYTWFTVPVGGVLVASVAQLFYAHRIYVISKVKIVTRIICFLTFIQLLCSILGAVLDFTNVAQPSVRDWMGTPSLITGATAGVICDLLIAVYMWRYLSRQMKGASRTTQVLVTKVVRLLLETGVLTAGTATTYMALFLFLGHMVNSDWYMLPGLSIGKLYANSMLVLLNNRFTILGGRNAPHPDFDIASYSRSEVARANTGPAVSHGITFARSWQVGAAFSGGMVQTTDLAP